MRKYGNKNDEEGGVLSYRGMNVYIAQLRYSVSHVASGFYHRRGVPYRTGFNPMQICLDADKN
jgi:hypothetical protein